jgi:hypothetical protein
MEGALRIATRFWIREANHLLRKEELPTFTLVRALLLGTKDSTHVRAGRAFETSN